MNRAESAPTLAAAKKKLKVPVWAWVLIAIILVLALSAAIVLPLVLGGRSSTTFVSPTSSVQPTTTVVPDPFSMLPQNAVSFQLLVPAVDGLVKGASDVLRVEGSKVDFVLVGLNARTLYYTGDTTAGSISAASIVVGNNTLSTWANLASANSLLYREFDPSPGDWYYCAAAASPPLDCNPQTWADTTLAQPRFFVGAVWNGVSNTCLFSLQQLGAQKYGFSAQTDDVAFPALAVEIPTLSGIDDTAVVTMLGSSQTSFVTVAVVERFNNMLSYVTYLNTTTTPTLQTLKFDTKGETLVWADMTRDGEILVVLTTKRLLVYTRDTSNAQFDFVLQDTLVWSTSAIQPTQVAVSSVTEQKLWTIISTEAKRADIAQFDVSTQRFVASSQYSVTPAFVDNCSGPASIEWADNGARLFLNYSDNIGKYEVAYLLSSVL